MKKYILYNIIFLSALSSCGKEIKSEKGAIDVISNVYTNASRSLDNVQSFHISKINYSNDTIIEIVPNNNIIMQHFVENDVFFIKDSTYHFINRQSKISRTNLGEITKKKGEHLKNKQTGAIFSNDRIPNYMHRRILKDTILFNKTYKRFEIDAPEHYTRYYVYPTDTILPYAIYKHAQKDFEGRIERIDSYNKKKDIFVTLQLVPRKKWDREVEEMFEFNQFLKNRIQ